MFDRTWPHFLQGKLNVFQAYVAAGGWEQAGADRGEEWGNNPNIVLSQRPTSEDWNTTTAGERPEKKKQKKNTHSTTAAQTKPPVSLMRSFPAEARCLHLEINVIMESWVCMKTLMDVFEGKLKPAARCLTGQVVTPRLKMWASLKLNAPGARGLWFTLIISFGFTVGIQ